MVHEVILPKLGMTMEGATIVRWLAAAGQRLEAEDPLLEIETEKTTYEIPAPVGGYLRQMLVQPGDVVPVVTVIAYISDRPDEPLPAAQAFGTDTRPPAATRPRAAPGVRRLARELGVDLHTVAGSGPGERIRLHDVQAAAAAAAPQQVAPVSAAAGEGTPAQPGAPEPADRVVPFTPQRRAIARRLAESFHTAVPVTLTTQAVVSDLAQLRSRLAPAVERQHGVRLTWNALILRAVALALRQHPALNAALEGEAVRYFGAVHLGVAVAAEEGLLVPIIGHADWKSVGEIAREAAELAAAARAGKLPPGATIGGTFTVSNLGAYEVDGFSPVLNPPQVAILGVGRAAEVPVVRDGQLVAATVMALSLVFDHRAVDGAPAAAFLQTVKRLLEQPYDLVV